MIQRLFFNRIDTETAGSAVTGQPDLVAVATTHKAQPLLAFVELAEARADIALNPAIVKQVPVFRRIKIGGFVQSGLLLVKALLIIRGSAGSIAGYPVIYGYLTAIRQSCAL
ncbi:hypothetical protein BN874_830060 [Candidatus Contendobacter odensis Run_B_J11]|uniref:Uncharacterized protein n=1 Tax=Candidatus Contendobacter odensis Run_B_J11 TaxID=1400861 RepID=A0A7U7GG24_9GAMM|nr:hypothetical protein BN874_830060 [Candidatus Contendobacter odensis Run_B_J11]